MKLRTLPFLASLVLVTSWGVGGAWLAGHAIAQESHVRPPEATAAQDERSAAEAGSTTVPFRLSSGYLIQVNGRIGTQTQAGRKFILDTGTTMSIIDAKLARKLELSRHGHLVSLNFDRKITWDVATVPFIQVGSITGRNVEVLVGNLADYSEFARHADAVIGMDLLRTANFTLEYDTQQIVFRPTQPSDGGAVRDPLLDCPVVVLQVQGRPVRLILDTGVEGVILFQNRVQKSVPGLSTTNSTGVMLGRRLQAQQVVLRDVRIGNTDMDVTALLVDSPPGNVLAGIDGLIGIAALKAMRVNFDFRARRLSWGLGEAQTLTATAQLEPALIQ